ncbi:hypothetical protein K488DRAFT_86160 [Vararia minispora EC-137]|uniref:Uncharacterized protein n=1 Tax=Vararia minispora EC-137 TaxID=1314806 RepID=A0ACB8QJW4_9AGAM|nr:hypothetical protein K488DRAFT_86160 [Vararia minispora EC-137]
MVTLDETLGAFYIGVTIGAALWGVSCLQTYTYYNDYPQDHIFLKGLVFVIWALDTVHQVLISHAVYIYLVKNFANPAILVQVVWSVLAEVVINALTALFVQLFFVYRIWKLSGGRLYLTIPVACLALGQFVGFMVYSGKAYAGNFTTFPQIMTLKATISTYIFMTSVLTYSAAPETFIYICFFFVMGRLYSNSFLATLNARNNIRDQSRADSHSLQSIPISGRSANISAQFNPSIQTPGVAVKVDTTLEYAHDRDFTQGDRKFGL